MNIIQLYLMGGIYFILGIIHFTHTGFYKPLMPKFLPAHNTLILWSGLAEIVLGLGIFFSKYKSNFIDGYYCNAGSLLVRSRKHVVSCKSTGGISMAFMVTLNHSICSDVLGLCKFTLVFSNTPLS